MSMLRRVMLGVLVVAVVASAIGVVWTRHRTRVLFTELTELHAQRDALNVQFGRQEIEHATWAEPSRIERVARQRLGMIDPPDDAKRLLRE